MKFIATFIAFAVSLSPAYSRSEAASLEKEGKNGDYYVCHYKTIVSNYRFSKMQRSSYCNLYVNVDVENQRIISD